MLSLFLNSYKEFMLKTGDLRIVGLYGVKLCIVLRDRFMESPKTGVIFMNAIS